MPRSTLLNFLPSEIVNMIISYVPHPLTLVIKPFIKEYEYYIYNSDNILSFNEYITNDPRDYFDKYNIKLHKKDNDNRLRCFHCGYYFQKYDLYYKWYTISKFGNRINCKSCCPNYNIINIT